MQAAKSHLARKHRVDDFSAGIRFTGTGDVIQVGDRVVIDCRSGVVRETCLPHTEDAKALACWDTGGLLIMFDDGILELHPLPFIETIHRAKPDDQVPPKGEPHAQ